MHSDHSETILVKVLNPSVGRTSDTLCGSCAGTGSSKVRFDKLGVVAAIPAPAPHLSFGLPRPSRIIEHVEVDQRQSLTRHQAEDFRLFPSNHLSKKNLSLNLICIVKQA